MKQRKVSENSKTCKYCGKEYYPRIDNYKTSSFCSQECMRNSRRTPIEKIKQDTESCGFEFIEAIFENSMAYVHYICPKHRDKGIQKRKYMDIKKRFKCPYCVGRNRTTEEFIELMDNTNSSIKIIGEYTGASKKIKCECTICEHQWETTPNALLRGSGCLICAQGNYWTNRQKSHIEFVEELSSLFPDIQVISEYTGANDKIRLKCKIDNTEWKTTPTYVLTNSHRKCCPTCTKEKMYLLQAKTHETFLEEVALTNPYIEILGTYKTYFGKILCKCKIHDFKWEASPGKLLTRKTGCPKCARYNGEVLLHELLDSHNISYEIQKRFIECKDKHTLPFDIYLPLHNICIEYDGEGHYYPVQFNGKSNSSAIKSFNITTYHDKIKNEYCCENEIILIRIPYWERDSMEEYLREKTKKLGINLFKDVA